MSQIVSEVDSQSSLTSIGQVSLICQPMLESMKDVQFKASYVYSFYVLFVSLHTPLAFSSRPCCMHTSAFSQGLGFDMAQTLSLLREHVVCITYFCDVMGI